MLGYIEFILVVYVVLLIYCVYVIIIYDGMCVRNMLNIQCEVVFSNIHENIGKLYQQVERVFGDG